MPKSQPGKRSNYEKAADMAARGPENAAELSFIDPLRARHTFLYYKGKTLPAPGEPLPAGAPSSVSAQDHMLLHGYFQSKPFLHRKGVNGTQGQFIFCENDENGDDEEEEGEIRSARKNPYDECNCESVVLQPMAAPAPATGSSAVQSATRNLTLTIADVLTPAVDHSAAAGSGKSVDFKLPEPLGVGRAAMFVARLLDQRKSYDSNELSSLDCEVLSPFPGPDRELWISSPNIDITPEPPILKSKQTPRYFRDGHLGLFEHTKWPQAYYPEEPHAIAIPGNPRFLGTHMEDQYGLGPAFARGEVGQESDDFVKFQDPNLGWDDLEASDFVVAVDLPTAAVGTLRKEWFIRFHAAISEIKNLAQAIFDEQDKAHPAYLTTVGEKEARVGYFLYQERRFLDIVRAVRHLKEVPMSSFDTLMWFREVQRILLDLRGWVIYMKVILPRWKDPCFRVKSPRDILPVRGCFTSNRSILDVMFRIGVPVWYVREAITITTITKIIRVKTVIANSVALSATTVMQHFGHTYQTPLWGHVGFETSADIHEGVRRLGLTSQPMFRPLLPFLPDEESTAAPAPPEAKPESEDRPSGLDEIQFDIPEDMGWPQDPIVPESVETNAKMLYGMCRCADVDALTNIKISVGDETAAPSMAEIASFKPPPSMSEAVLPVQDARLAMSAESSSHHDWLSRERSQYTTQNPDVIGYRGQIPTASGHSNQVEDLPNWAPNLAPGWRFALREVRQGEWSNASFRYPLPSCHIFLGKQKNDTLALWIHNWLRIRMWCLTQVPLHSPSPHHHLLTTMQVINPPQRDRRVLMTIHEWRAAVEGRYQQMPYNENDVRPQAPLEDIKKLPLGSLETGKPHRPESFSTHNKKSKWRLSMSRLAARIDVHVRFGVYAGFSPYDAAVARCQWGNQEITSSHALQDRDLWAEVLWELSVMNFRLEFADLDRELLPHVYKDADQRFAAAREAKVCGIWLSAGIRLMWHRSDSQALDEQDPFSSLDSAHARHVVRSMAVVMADWPSPRRIRDAKQLLYPPRGVDQSQSLFDEYREDVYFFYTQTFYETRGRLPTAPYLQPASLESRLVSNVSHSCQIGGCYRLSF